MRRSAAIGLAAVAFAVAGCGGSSYSGGGSGSSTGGATTASSATGLSLYTFSRDSASHSNCTGACAKNWPPATAAPGLDKAKLKTIKRSDGTTQVALGGKPLYHFVGDKKAGDVNGNGIVAFGGSWTAVSKAAKSQQKTQPSPSGSRYGY